MKKSLLAASLLALALPVSAAEYTLDPHHTHAHFFIDHFGASTNMGSFNRLSGDLQFDPVKRSGSIDVRLPLANLQTALKNLPPICNLLICSTPKNIPKCVFNPPVFILQGNAPAKLMAN